MRKVRVSLLQLSTKLGKIEENYEKILNGIEYSLKEKAEIIVTPELATIGYGSGDIYLDKVRENLEVLEKIKKKVKDFYLILGYMEEDSKGFFYNSAALIYNGEIIGNYRKVQLVNYRLFDEKRYFKAGNRMPVFKTKFGKIGILICEDVWFPEPPRAMALRGAEVLFVIGASPFERKKDEIWINYLKQRVYDNILPVCFCNQAGSQEGIVYMGFSMYLNARGEIVCKGKLIEEDIVIFDLDLDEYKRIRRRDIRLREVRKEVIEDLLRACEEMENEGN
jgi:NAD+ synthase (glutamine-hydrolysing)